MSRIEDLKMDTGYLLSTLKTLLNIPSPTGHDGSGGRLSCAAN